MLQIKNKSIYPSGLILLAFIIVSDFPSWGQATGDPKEDFLYGEYYLAQNLFSEAIPFYLSALDKNPDNSNINYRVGLCYMKTIGDQHNALPYLKKAVKEINIHYVEGKYGNTGAPAEAWLLLGDAYLRDDQLLEASRAYHEYKNFIGDSNPEMFEVIMKRISGLGVSYEYQRDQEDISMINMGENINSRFSDYNPVVSGDQKIMIYTQYWETSDRIMMSRLTDNGWGKPEDISSQIGSDGECYTTAISFDGKELYLVCHDELMYDIYVSKYSNAGWSKKKLIQGKVNSRSRESSMCISADGSTLYFASDRPGGEGGFDLYMAHREGTEWTDIVNLGKPINTKDNEEAPYISYDGSVLYFSSNGHETVGNMDIFYSESDETAGWQEPVNMGVPVNTTNDDVFFVYFKDTHIGYLSRDLPQGFGKNDIYRLQSGKNISLPSDGAIVEAKIEPSMELSDGSKVSEDNMNTQGITIDDNKEKEDGTVAQTNSNTSAEGLIVTNTETQNIAFENTDQSPAKTESGSNSLTGVSSDDEILNVNAGYSGKGSDSIPTYTIQIYALRKPADPKKIKLSPLKVSPGTDGLYRYTHGEYIGYSNALILLDKIRTSGFPDAFIRNIITVQNYSGLR